MSQEINEGDEVRHALFGDGRVTSIDPLSSIATIDFVLAGSKRMFQSSSMEVLSRGQIFTARQEQARQKQEQARWEQKQEQAKWEQEQEQARRKQEQARQKSQEAMLHAKEIARQDYLVREAIRKNAADKELERQQAVARAAASEKEFGQRIVQAWGDAWRRMDHPDSFGRTGTIETLSGGGPKQGWGKRKTPQVLAIQERQGQLFLTVANIFEEFEYDEAEEDGFHIEGLGYYKSTVTKTSLDFFQNYQFPFNGVVVTVVFDELKEPKKESIRSDGFIGLLNEAFGWLETITNSLTIKDHPF